MAHAPPGMPQAYGSARQGGRPRDPCEGGRPSGPKRLASRAAAADHRGAMQLLRSTALLVLGYATACAEPETPPILAGPTGACGSVVEGASPSEVECPSACPVAVDAYRVINNASCQRASTRYVACIAPGSTGGSRGAAMLDTPDGPIFIDDPAFDCNRDDGCAEVETVTTERWTSCDASEEAACDCVCSGGECAFDRHVATLQGCGFASPCAPLTGDTERTEELLQCYLDELANGGPALFEVDVPQTNDVTGETSTARRVMIVNRREAIRLDSLGFQSPSALCALHDPTFYFDCDPGEPSNVNVENDQGTIERVPCTDPRAWLIECEAAAPMCLN